MDHGSRRKTSSAGANGEFTAGHVQPLLKFADQGGAPAKGRGSNSRCGKRKQEGSETSFRSN
jgi:hypothetical protein